jgi:hypothetical protein
MAAVRSGPLYSRRLISRVETRGDVWVCWRCEGIEDVSRVCDLSVGGLFLSTPIPLPLGAKARIDFLVPEGQIRAEAVIQYVIPQGGLGLKFTAITDQDCPNLIRLINRICTPQRPVTTSTHTSLLCKTLLAGLKPAAEGNPSLCGRDHIPLRDNSTVASSRP